MSNPMSNNPLFSFERTENGLIDARKYTLYEVLLDPRLDTLNLDKRQQLFYDFISDANRLKYSANKKYAQNGANTERILVDPDSNQTSRLVNFASNNYLNLATHPQVVAAAMEALETFGAGSGSSCITTGRTRVKSELEQEIAQTFDYEDALVYPSGFMANTGVLQGLLRSNDVAIVDMYAHASIMDGVENRNKILFQHNDMASLERTIKRADSQYANKIIVVDGVYSMDGDIANLPEIVGLCKKYRCKLMVDEAHAFGVIGKHGLGIADHFGMSNDVIDILVGTLSKAIGSSGGFVSGSKELITYLKYASRPYFFTTAPFIPSMAAALEAIRIIKSDASRRQQLWENIAYFKAKVLTGGFNIGAAQTAIFPIILGNHHLVMDTTVRMGQNGVLAMGVVYPAVSRKQARIRMNVTAEMSREQLDKGYEVLCQSLAQEQPDYFSSTLNLPT
ncbi:MAG TPA: 8-amino-7-oxononanoate synthase [Saprospirales bacterium]|nr:8-amino-7-oxononanoate synthase [Saprospirales bacterium]